MIEIVGVGDDAPLRPGDVEDKDERIAGPGDGVSQNAVQASSFSLCSDSASTGKSISSMA